MDVLVQLPLSEEQRARLEAAAPGARFEYVKPRTVTREQVEAADAIVGNVPTEMLAGASGLRLLQLNSAGYEQYAAPGVLPDGCALCCATGGYGLAGLFAAMGAAVCGGRSRAAAPHHPFDDMGTLSDLPRLLPQADVVCSVLPSTPQTAGIADQAFFDAMRNGAYFANAGRGDLVDQRALVEALASGHLSGAALDVCTPEPLPAESPLWDAPNLLLTPHVSGQFHLAVTLDNIVGIAAENLAHLAAGEALRNHVNA